jgi:hypothetical protein
MFCFEFFPDGWIFCGKLLQRSINVDEQRGVLFEELLRDGFDAERVF